MAYKRPTKKPTEPDPGEAEVVIPGTVPRDDAQIAYSVGGEQPAWKDELTPALIEALVATARVGGFKRQTALACGVRPETLEWWLDEGMRADGPPLMRQLSARFLSVQESSTLSLVSVIQRAALCGDWEAALALLKQRDPYWRGGDKHIERQNAPSETSLQQRYAQLVALLRNPTPEMGAVMKEAGVRVIGAGEPDDKG